MTWSDTFDILGQVANGVGEHFQTKWSCDPMYGKVNKRSKTTCFATFSAITRERNVSRGWELCYCDPLVVPLQGDLDLNLTSGNLWWSLLPFCYIWPSEQKSQWVDLCTTFTRGVIGGQNLALLITPVRKVVLTCHDFFGNQNVKLHLTPRSKGQIWRNMLILGENEVNR